jgi:hypothetical protein
MYLSVIFSADRARAMSKMFLFLRKLLGLYGDSLKTRPDMYLADEFINMSQDNAPDNEHVILVFPVERTKRNRAVNF